MSVRGGPIQLVKSVTTAELEENGGKWRIAGRVALRVHGFATADRAIQGGPVAAVYVVSQAQVDSGDFSVRGGDALPLGNITVLGGADRPVKGVTAVPVFLVGGSLT